MSTQSTQSVQSAHLFIPSSNPEVAALQSEIHRVRFLLRGEAKTRKTILEFYTKVNSSCLALQKELTDLETKLFKLQDKITKVGHFSSPKHTPPPSDISPTLTSIAAAFSRIPEKERMALINSLLAKAPQFSSDSSE